MKKYLISIENSDGKRRKSFFSQNSFSIEKNKFNVFGVVGTQLNAMDYFNQGVRGKHKALTPGELGCTLSHLAALTDFINSDEEYAIIFEDDALERFPICFTELREEVKSLNLTSCFLLSLGGIQLKICDRVRGRYLDDILMGQKLLKVDHDFLEYLSYAYAYIVDREMAKLLLQYHQTPQIYDHWQDLTRLQKPFAFYATYLFNHPEIDHALHSSYLESERRDICENDRNYDGSMRYWRRKFKKRLLNHYNK